MTSEPRALMFEVIGDAVPQGSMRAFSTKTGKTVVVSDNANLHEWRDAIGVQAKQALARAGIAEPWSGPINVVAVFWMQRPKSVSVRQRPMPIVKPDLDKLARAVLDALSGLVYRDDAQVCELEVKKRYADSNEPSAAIRVWR